MRGVTDAKQPHGARCKCEIFQNSFLLEAGEGKPVNCPPGKSCNASPLLSPTVSSFFLCVSYFLFKNFGIANIQQEATSK